jgi:hypothetical protein
MSRTDLSLCKQDARTTDKNRFNLSDAAKGKTELEVGPTAFLTCL